jgi:hypothetical protein
MKKLLAFTLLIILVGCGGGSTNSNSNSPSSTPGQAQAVYFGTASNGDAFETIILPNDEYYALYGPTSGNEFSISGMLTGQGSSNNGNYTANVTDFYGSSATVTGSVSATYTVGASINGTLTATGSPAVTFNGTVMPSSQFNYKTAAKLSDIVGTWAGGLLDGTLATVTINSNGAFSGSDSSGCSFSGTITPDNSGKNFFDISLTYGASPCLLPNQSASGMAVDYLLSDGVTRQLLAAVASGTSYGTVFVASN